MKMIKLLSFLAIITIIALRSNQHFIPFQDLNQCLLADICNHTWIPECGFDLNHTHHRLFIDECDMFEFNCDNNMLFKVMNYSACFAFDSSCPTVPNLLTRVQGFYIYYADGRRVMYSHTPYLPPRKRTTYYTLPTTATRRTLTTNWKERRRYTPQATGHYKPWSITKCGPCGKIKTQVADLPRETRRSQLLLEPPPIEFVTKRKTERTTRRTTKRTTKKPKPTTQILRTGTIGTVILKKETVMKNGKMVFKVIKGYMAPITKTTDDSDFLQ